MKEGLDDRTITFERAVGLDTETKRTPLKFYLAPSQTACLTHHSNVCKVNSISQNQESHLTTRTTLAGKTQ